MELSGKMSKMADVISKHDAALRKYNDLYKHFLAPDIPEKIIRKLIKYFDSHLPANSLVAFYDTSLLGNGMAGFVYTKDGMYYKYIGKAVYFRFADIRSMEVSGDNLILFLDSEDMSLYTLIDALDFKEMQKMLEELIAIDREYGQSSGKLTGKVKSLDLPPDMMKKCNAIIHTASVACGGVGTGLAQLPASDNAVIVPIQITMIVSLGVVFELDITESGAKSIIASAGASIAGRTVSQFLWGWIPAIGNVINTATAAGLTEAIGWLAVENFYARWVEDRNKGRFDGMKDGYNEASAEYERKLRAQADEFLQQMKDVQREREEYEHLLDEYEHYIKELERKCAAAETIREMQEIYDNLKKLRTA